MVDNSSNWNTTILSIFFGILLLFLIFLWFESREEDSDGNKVFNPEKLGIILKNIFGLCFPDIILIFFANLCICCGYVGTSCLEQIQAEEEIRETKRLARLAANLSKKSKQKKKKVKSRSQSDNEFEAVSSADEDDDIELGSNSGSSTGRRSKRSLSSSNSSNNNSNDNSNNSNSNNNNNNNNKINQKSSVSFPTHSNRVVNNSPGYDQNDRNERGMEYISSSQDYSNLQQEQDKDQQELIDFSKTEMEEDNIIIDNITDKNSSNYTSVIIDNSSLTLLPSSSCISTSTSSTSTTSIPNPSSNSNTSTLTSSNNISSVVSNSTNNNINNMNNINNNLPSTQPIVSLPSSTTSSATLGATISTSKSLSYYNDPSPDEVSDSPSTVLNIFPLSKLNKSIKSNINTNSTSNSFNPNSTSSSSSSSSSIKSPLKQPKISSSSSLSSPSISNSTSMSSTTSFSSPNISDPTKNSILVNHLLTKKMIEDHIAAEDELLALQTSLLKNTQQQQQQQYDQQFY